MPEKDPKTGETIMYICQGLHCGRHAKFMEQRLEQVRAKGVKVQAGKTLCMGMCEMAPNVQVKGRIHNKMNPIKISELAKKL